MFLQIRTARPATENSNQTPATPQAHPTFINSVAFDGAGGRVYAGDAAGTVGEFAVDLTPGAGLPMLKPLRSNGQLAGQPIVQVTGAASFCGATAHAFHL